MLYRRWPGLDGEGSALSMLGFGTTHLPVSPDPSNAEIERCIELLLHAFDRGVNYIDTSPTYANGFAEAIAGEAIRRSGKRIYVGSKSGLSIDKTAGELVTRVRNSIKMLGVPRLDFFYIWSVMGIANYKEIIHPGGLYEGALSARDQGLIDRICISLHCSPEESLEIVSSGLFEGVTISLNALNYEKWIPFLKYAEESGIGVMTMNSLAGGLIPRYPQLFESLDDSDNAVSVKALRFLGRFPSVTVTLSGMDSLWQVDENCSAFECSEDEAFSSPGVFKLPVDDHLCTGCGYCKPCPKGIPIPECMQAYNHRILMDAVDSGRDPVQCVNDSFIRLLFLAPKIEHRSADCGALFR